MPDGRPRAVQNEALRLGQLRRATLVALIELIEITGALVDRFGDGVGKAADELWSSVAPGQKQRVIDGFAGVVDCVYGAEVGIKNAINCLKFGHYVGIAAWQRDRRRGKVSAESRLLTGWHEVEIKTKIAVGLTG